VRALNSLNQPGDWSQTWTFTISITPGSLQLIEPANGSKLESTTAPNFNWHTVDNALEYEIQVDDNPDFSSPQYDARQVESSFPIQAPLSQGSYSWRVRAFNEDGRSGDWSATWNFIISIPPAVPTLTGPANDSIQVLTDIAPLTWTSETNATSYELQLDDSPSFDSPNFSQATADSAFRLPNTLSQGVYSWRVRGVNVYGTAGGWSTPWRLSIFLPPDPPLLKSPARDTQLESTKLITFAWQGVPSAAQYQIQVDNTPNFSSPEFQTSAAVDNITANQYFQTGQYSWRVRSLTNSGIAGAWSEVWNFSIPLPAPIQKSPDPNITVNKPPTFEWLGVQNAGQYEIQIGEDERFNSSFTRRTSSTKITITTQDGLTDHYQPNCNNQHIFTYYWKVRARDLSDNPGFWSMTLPVTIDFGCGVIY